MWDTKTWKQVAEAPGHKLTVIQLEFSHDDQHLVSVSRDLGHCLYRVVSTDGGGASLKLVAKLPKAHTRISWSCSWAVDDSFFASCSRDGVVKVWSVKPDSADATQYVTEAWRETLDDSVTSVSFAPLPTSSPCTPACDFR